MKLTSAKVAENSVATCVHNLLLNASLFTVYYENCEIISLPINPKLNGPINFD